VTLVSQLQVQAFGESCSASQFEDETTQSRSAEQSFSWTYCGFRFSLHNALIPKSARLLAKTSRLS